MADKTCPRLRFTAEQLGKNVCIAATGGKSKTKYGEICLSPRDGRLKVGWVGITEFEDKDKQPPMRCGIGTRLYEQALRYACKRNTPLCSDMERTKCSDGFWQKQVGKKKARSVTTTCGKRVTNAAVRDQAAPNNPCGYALQCRSGVDYYCMTGCHKDLSGGKRRKR